MKNQMVKQDAILKKKTSFEVGIGNAEWGKANSFICPLLSDFCPLKM